MIFSKHIKIILLFLLGFINPNLSAQHFPLEIATKWSDSFAEWIIYTDDELVEGELKLRWLFSNDWTEWEYSLGDERGTIKMKWKGNPNEWELRSGRGEVVSMRTIWHNDPREWRIRNGNKQWIFKRRHGNIPDDWLLKSNANEGYYIYTAWEGDPRSWLVVDEMQEQLSFSTQMSIIFTAVYNTLPR